MAPHLAYVLFVGILVAVVKGQVQCPRCRNKYDPSSCSLTQNCGVGWNWCELRVHTADFYSVEYVCQNYNDCLNHETDGCKPDMNEVCAYCCEDPVTCRIQRDDLFNYVFPTAGPPATTANPNTPAVTVPPPTPAVTPDPTGIVPEDIFHCPRCTNPYDHTSCTQTQECFNRVSDTCELDIYTSDSNRLEYSCQKYDDCTKNANLGCNTGTRDICSYCCLDPDSCKLQRDDLFDFVFPPETSHPPIITLKKP